MLLMTTDNLFDIVNDSKTDELPDGDAKLAWSGLAKLYKPDKPRDLTSLQKNFTNCLLFHKWEDPNKWLLHLNVIIRHLEKI